MICVEKKHTLHFVFSSSSICFCNTKDERLCMQNQMAWDSMPRIWLGASLGILMMLLFGVGREWDGGSDCQRTQIVIVTRCIHRSSDNKGQDKKGHFTSNSDTLEWYEIDLCMVLFFSNRKGSYWKRIRLIFADNNNPLVERTLCFGCCAAYLIV